MSGIPLYAYIIAAILFLLWVGLVVYLILRRRKENAAQKQPVRQVDPGVIEELERDVRDRIGVANKLLLTKVPDKSAQAAISRILVLGEAGSGKSTLVHGMGMGALLSADNAPPGGDKASCNLWLFKKGLVVEAAGRLLLTADGQDPGDEGFNILLAAIKKERAERPIDGIILTLPSRDLLADAGSIEEKRHKASILQKRITDAQRKLEMRVPIYVVVTQCDQITGFSSFVSSLSPDRRDAILGWSSPHAPFSGKVVDWTDETMNSVRHDLAREQARRFAAAGHVRDVDDFFLFPAELGELGEGLRAYIDELFIPSAHDEPFVLRGIYFCGGAKPPPPPPEQSAASGATMPMELPGQSMLFARELFERKIFPEANIARPSFMAVRRRNRVILALQALSVLCALVFGGVMALESDRLARETASITPFLQALEVSLHQMSGEAAGADPTGELGRARAIALFKGIGAIQTDGLRSTFIPGSWVSRIDRRIEDAVHTGYERIILSAFRTGLTNKTEALLRSDDAPFGGGVHGSTAALEKTHEFIHAENWLRELTTFESHVSRFDNLLPPLDGRPPPPGVPPERHTPDARVQDVADLCQYVLAYKVEPSFKAEYYRRALARGAGGQQFDIAAHHDAAVEKAKFIFKALEQRMLQVYSDNLLRDDIDALKKGLNELDRNDPDYTPEKLWALRDAISRVEKDLAAPGLAWIAGGTLPANPGLGRLLDAVKASHLLGSGLQDSFKDSGETGLFSLRKYLEEASTPLSGYILDRKEGIVQMQLSPFILSLKAPTDTLRRQSFMAGDDDVELPPEIDETRLSWNVDLLKETAKLPKEYETFAQDGGVKAFPSQVQTTVGALAVRKLKTKTLSGVAKSANREIALQASQSRLIETAREDVANFGLASVPLREIIAAFGRLSVDDARDRLRVLVRAQGSRLLIVSARVLEAASLYEVRDGSFAWWNGEGTPVFQAFGVPDAARLNEYTVSQRGRADTFAKELAEPVLSTLQSVEVGVEEDQSVAGMSSWQRVVDPLHDFENKKAGNGVSRLEHFLMTDLPTITFENCLPELDRVGQGVVNRDYFTDRMMRIRGLLRDQCAALAVQDIRIRYAALRRAFNRDLAGRFPFWKPELGNVGRPDDAPPDVVRRFLTNAADFRKRYRGLLVSRGDKSAAEVTRFLDKLDKVNGFMMPMWAQTEVTADGVYDVGVDFRIQQSREVGGNQIAEWAAKFAEDKLVMDGPKSTSKWHIGDPVELYLRWAKDGDNIPSASQEDPSITVKDRSVTFHEHGAWALLRILYAHQTSDRDTAGAADSLPHVLRFSVRTIPDPTGGFIDRVGEGGGIVRVFVRFVVTGAEKDKPLKYPEFPTVAPSL